MICVYKKPGSPPEIVDTDGSLAALQELVGGYLELAPVEGASVYVNEEGVVNDLPPNVVLERVGCVHGPVVVLGPVDADGNETSLTTATARVWCELLDRCAVR